MTYNEYYAAVVDQLCETIQIGVSDAQALIDCHEQLLKHFHAMDIPSSDAAEKLNTRSMQISERIYNDL